MCLLTMRLIKKIGYIRLIIVNYVILCLFLLAHLYPTIWLLLPAYLMLGLTLGPSWVCKFSLVILFASRISCGQHECPATVPIKSENTDEHKTRCNRNERVRRLARWFHAIQDIGMLLGAVIASIIISCAISESNCMLPIQQTINNSRLNTTLAHQITPNDTIDLSGSTFNRTLAQSEHTANSKSYNEITNDLTIMKSIFNQRDDLLDSLFNTNEHGIRICGAGSCPTWYDNPIELNRTEEYSWFTYSGTITLTLFFIAFALFAIVLSCLSQHGDNTFKYGHFKTITDTILFASPLAYFIGTEQGYVLGGFTRVNYFILIAESA